MLESSVSYFLHNHSGQFYLYRADINLMESARRLFVNSDRSEAKLAELDFSIILGE